MACSRPATAASRPLVATVPRLVWCLLLLVVGPAGAWIAERNINISIGSHMRTWVYSSLGPGGSNAFKFKPGGTAKISLSCSWTPATAGQGAADWIENAVYLLLCQEDRIKLHAEGSLSECSESVNACKHSLVYPTQVSCSLHPPIDVVTKSTQVTATSIVVQQSQSVNSTGRVKFVVVTCCGTPSPADYTCQAFLDVRNLGGTHLSVDEFGLPRFYLLYFLALCILLGVWCVNALYHWRFNNRLHTALTLLLFFRVGEAAALYWSWLSISKSGVESVPTDRVRYVLASLKWSFYFLFLTSGSFGMGIAVKTPRHMYRIVLSNVLVLASLLMFFFVNSYALAVTVILALLGVFSAVRHVRYIMISLDKFLHAERRFFRNNADAQYSSKRTLKDRVGKKLRLLRVVLVFTLAFPLVYIIGSAVAQARFQSQTNIQAMLRECFEAFFLLLLLWAFRLRECCDYALIKIDTHPKESEQSIVLLGAGKTTMFFSQNSERCSAIATSST